ncbi:hypothetical protein D3C83_34700 [compost metagenome]
MLSRASYTEAPSIRESGRARYTYSKMHGLRLARAAHCWAWKLPSSSMKMASPGAMSRSTRNPSASTATDSEATMYSVPASVSL